MVGPKRFDKNLPQRRSAEKLPAMAVYTTLTDAQLEQMLCIYTGLGSLEKIEGIAAGSINSMFKVTLSEAVVYLRIGEDKKFSDLMYELKLLGALDDRKHRLGGVKTPKMLQNCIGGTFFPVGNGKFAMLFEALEGRELGVFERDETHVYQVGAFLARAHSTLRKHGGRRKNPYRLATVQRWVQRLDIELKDRELARQLGAVLDEVERKRTPLLPRGVIHGDLFLNNTKWRRGQLDAVFDWEMAGTDHLATDLAITLLAWAWERGEPGRLDPALARALVDGYQSVRPLKPSEVRGFYAELLLGALRFCASRVRDFHLDQEQGRDVGERVFLDYREYAERIDAVRSLGPRGLRDMLFQASKEAS